MGKTFRRNFDDKGIPEYQSEKNFKGDEKRLKHLGIKKYSDKKKRYAQNINQYDF